MSLLLKDRQHVEAFNEFLKEEHADENLAFFLAVEEFKATASSPMMLDRVSVVDKLFRTFILPDSPRQVNIPSQVLRDLLAQRKNVDLNMFDAAQREVVATLRTNSFSRFLESCFYTGLARGIQYRQEYLDPMVLTTFRNICYNDIQWKKKKNLGRVACFSCNGVDDDLIIKARCVIRAPPEKIVQACYDWVRGESTFFFFFFFFFVF